MDITKNNKSNKQLTLILARFLFINDYNKFTIKEFIDNVNKHVDNRFVLTTYSDSSITLKSSYYYSILNLKKPNTSAIIKYILKHKD